jgi:uncharacterized protein YacL
MKVYQWLDKKLETILFEMGMEKFIILEVFLMTFILAFLELFPINSIGMCVFAVVIGSMMNIVFIINFFNIFMVEGRVKGRRKLEWR